MGVVVGLLVLGLATAAGVGLIGSLGKAIKEVTLPLQHEDVIRQQARQKQLDPALVAAVIFRESKFRPRTSHAGATGLMQILPSTAHFIASRSGGTRFEESDLANPQVNIAYGTYYMRYLRDRYDSDMLMLAAYNAGERNVDRWLEDARREGRSSGDLDLIRFPETRAYVEKVFEARDEYRDKYPSELGL